LSGGASPEGSEEKERTGEAAACAVEKVRVRRPPKERKARRGWRGDDARPNDDEEDEEDEEDDEEKDEEYEDYEDEDKDEDDVDEDEGGNLKRGDDRRRFARGLTQRNLASISGDGVCVCVEAGLVGLMEAFWFCRLRNRAAACAPVRQQRGRGRVWVVSLKK